MSVCLDQETITSVNLTIGLNRANAQFEQVGTAFVQHYYQTFDSGLAAKNFGGLAALYQADSMYVLMIFAMIDNVEYDVMMS